MRGLMANPKGEIIERPIKANFMEGLTVLEYFISTHGARKGLADTALRTADSGYLTRRLVDVAQDVIIREPDCGTEEFIELPVFTRDGGRQRQPRRALRGAGHQEAAASVLVERGQEIDRAECAAIAEAMREELDEGADPTVPVRSTLKCEAVTGVCQACYGRSLASGQVAQIGDAVGIIAAQSIGEPGTQLTMRTFHTGGVAGADITHGLPRVVELFEARKPKGVAHIAEQDGVVAIESTEKALHRRHHRRRAAPSTATRSRRRTRLFVDEGQKVEAGTQLNEGSLYPHDLLKLRGRTETERYLVKEVQEVYKSQGVDINDKHIELIVRQMLKKVRVDQKGDTGYLPGQFVDRYDFARENARIKSEKGETAQFEEIILGITKASLNTDSFLSAASFQETTKVLTDAALEGKKDTLNGLKENVIIGKLIPAATGLKRYRRIEIEPAEPLPRAMDEVGLLDQDEIAAELGLAEGDGAGRLRLGLRRGPGQPGGDRGRRRRPRLRRGARRPRRPGRRAASRAQAVGCTRGRWPPTRSAAPTCASVSPVAGSVATSRVGAARAAAQRGRRRRGRRRSRPAAGRRRAPRAPRASSARACRRGGEGQVRERAGELERERQVLVGLLLPAAGPDELEVLGQRRAGGLRPSPKGDGPRRRRLPRRPAGRRSEGKPNRRDDAVDVDEEQRFVHVAGILSRGGTRHASRGLR